MEKEDAIHWLKWIRDESVLRYSIPHEAINIAISALRSEIARETKR